MSRCDHHGFYMPFQCSSSHCWCVNRFSGKSIPDSKRLWDFYWINLDAKFGCPPQKDLNNLIDSEEDENSSRWRRSVDDLYFPVRKKYIYHLLILLSSNMGILHGLVVHLPIDLSNLSTGLFRKSKMSS